jgi:hypothetical protein
MTTSAYFPNFSSNTEQTLLQSLTRESIQQKGIDVKYVPRVLVNYDELFGADDSSRYNNAYTIEMYILSTSGFSGDRDFFSQFGHQIRDEVKFSVAIDRFLTAVGTPASIPRPDEGDLIYFPLNKKCFIVKFVEAREATAFYQLGKLFTWELTCELFEYSGEKIATGDPTIDSIKDLSLSILDWATLDANGNPILDANGNYIPTANYHLEAINPGSENDYLPVVANTFIHPNFNPFRGQD